MQGVGLRNELTNGLLRPTVYERLDGMAIDFYVNTTHSHVKSPVKRE